LGSLDHRPELPLDQEQDAPLGKESRNEEGREFCCNPLERSPQARRGRLVKGPSKSPLRGKGTGK